MDKISPIKERILQFIERQGIKKVDFSEKTNISYSNLKGKSLYSEIGGEQIAKILEEYGEISPEWLVTGKGEMLKDSEQNITQNGNNNTNNGHNISGNRNKIEQTNAELLEIIREKDRQIASLHKIIEKLSS
ncbi:hypothetical protein QIU18_13245 [Capnocytophaga canimorsus]|nr:hypothetical protein [Capnocytophaga canimorsus]WGU70383.1 hypothetical protein QIU18_13245 [Capnocytophaga canimorsus]